MKKIFLLCALIFSLAAAPASAHYIWMEPVGQQPATAGETLTVNVYAHADEADEMMFFAASVGFDDTALGGELTFDSYTLNSAFDPNPGMFPGVYEADGSLAREGGSWIKDIGGQGPNWGSVAVAADSDLLLFSVDFTYTNPEAEWTGDDVWLEWNTPNSSAVFWMSAMSDTDIGANGVDYAIASAVPVPGAALLLGSGLLGLFGIRRRNA